MTAVTTLVRPTILLSRRSILAVLRQPQVIAPSIIFPLFFAALNSSAFARATDVPGWPYPDIAFLTFQMPASVIQGVLFGSLVAGTEMAADIDNGFFDRLVSAPASRMSILLGRVAGATALAAVQSLFFVAVLVVFGAEMRAGLAGTLVLVVVGGLLGAGVGGFGMTVALRTGQAEAVQAFFPLIFVSLFLSSAFFPRELMSGWYQTVAGVNPMSHLVEAMRDLVAVGWSARDAAVALAIGSGLCVISLAVAGRSLRKRVDA